MSADPIKACKSDNAVALSLRFNKSRHSLDAIPLSLKVAAKVQWKNNISNMNTAQRLSGMMNAIAAIIIFSSLLVFGAPAQGAEGKYYSDQEYKKLIQGGFLKRSNFYPDGNSGQLELLIMCIDRGDAKVLEKLLDAAPGFANVSEGGSRCSPVHWAAFKGDTNILAVLVKKRADIKKKGTNWDITALHIARDSKTADFLIQHGADFEAKDALGQTPLMYAAKRGNLEVAQCLIENGAKIESKDKNGSTALYLAETYGQTNLTRLLISRLLNKRPI